MRSDDGSAGLHAGQHDRAEWEDTLIERAEASREPLDPEVTLFADDSPPSMDARRLLEGAGVRFRTLSATGPNIPAVVFGGIEFDRLPGVRELIQSLAAFDTALFGGLRQSLPRGLGARLKPLEPARERDDQVPASRGHRTA